MFISGHTARAGRLALRWTIEEMAERSGLCTATISVFEAEQRKVSFETIFAIRASLEAGGLEFLPEDASGRVGIRLPLNPRIQTGIAAMAAL